MTQKCMATTTFSGFSVLFLGTYRMHALAMHTLIAMPITGPQELT